MTVMIRTRHGFAGLTALFALGASTLVQADTLYKCEGPGGTVAYTNKKESFTGCKSVGNYVAQKPAATSPQAKRAWDYQERPDPKAASSGVSSTAAVVASIPEPAKAPDPVPVEPAGSRTMTSATTSTPAPKIVRGAVYRVDRTNGITEYTNVRPRDGRFALLFSYISTCVACDVNSKINFSQTALNLVAFREEIARASLDFGVDASLLRAIMHAESAFNPMALSNKGAQGLMQLMPGTASDLGVVDAFNAAENIRGGAQYLAQMLRNFDGDERLATAAYNAGPGAVQKYSGVPPYAETQVYVERVATLRDRYRKAL